MELKYMSEEKSIYNCEICGGNHPTEVHPKDQEQVEKDKSPKEKWWEAQRQVKYGNEEERAKAIEIKKAYLGEVEKTYQQYVSENGAVAYSSFAEYLQMLKKFDQFVINHGMGADKTGAPINRYDLGYRFLMDAIVNNIGLSEPSRQRLRRYYETFSPYYNHEMGIKDTDITEAARQLIDEYGSSEELKNDLAKICIQTEALDIVDQPSPHYIRVSGGENAEIRKSEETFRRQRTDAQANPKLFFGDAAVKEVLAVMEGKKSKWDITIEDSLGINPVDESVKRIEQEKDTFTVVKHKIK
jgi:hypothetical protein